MTSSGFKRDTCHGKIHRYNLIANSRKFRLVNLRGFHITACEERLRISQEQVEAFETLDDSTAEFLRKKESNMREIVGKAYTELGRELKEAQEVLRKQGSSEGTFMAWYQSLGFSSMQVSRFIQRFELLTLCEEPVREILEELPVTLTYEIAKPSAESTPAKSQAKAEVLDVKSV